MPSKDAFMPFEGASMPLEGAFMLPVTGGVSHALLDHVFIPRTTRWQNPKL
jgi:hypothetical protein